MIKLKNFKFFEFSFAKDETHWLFEDRDKENFLLVGKIKWRE